MRQGKERLDVIRQGTNGWDQIGQERTRYDGGEDKTIDIKGGPKIVARNFIIVNINTSSHKLFLETGLLEFIHQIYL